MSATTNVRILREAAGVMRTRAMNATGSLPGAEWYERHDLAYALADSDSATELQAADDADHIAAFSPVVALVLADLLDVTADHWDAGCELIPIFAELLMAADLYLGSEFDPEEFCPTCLAGMESPEHFEKCGGA